jgi:hypothetical protein
LRAATLSEFKIAEPATDAQTQRPFAALLLRAPAIACRPQQFDDVIAVVRLLSSCVYDFVEHGSAVIEQVRQERPEIYLKVIASLVPRELHFKSAVRRKSRAGL